MSAAGYWPFRREMLVRKYPSCSGELVEELGPMGDQVMAELLTETDDNGAPRRYSPGFHNLPILTEMAEWMRKLHPTPPDLEFLLESRFGFEQSRLSMADEVVPGLVMRRAELHALYMQALENAVNDGRRAGGQYVHWADGDMEHAAMVTGDMLFPVVIGWSFPTVARTLLENWMTQCFVCAWRFHGARLVPATCGLLVSSGAIARLISCCDRCAQYLDEQTSGLDYIRPLVRAEIH
ncbi:hypothetical protein [Nocardia cyriacigeorgica]|uniref:hypothetical protein n=1 Tax=Nocardia cyriacigeorgica TaxID=135487 RepID=UPI002454B06B|nr:hypothetical protein [Nocardia cyriacigeorgica]